jgi:hypothetical protein
VSDYDDSDEARRDRENNKRGICPPPSRARARAEAGTNCFLGCGPHLCRFATLLRTAPLEHKDRILSLIGCRNSGNSSWLGTFGRTFINGVLHGDRQPGESSGAYVARNANETTFGASGEVTADALAAVVAVGAAVGSLSQIRSPWANSASTITNVLGQTTGQTPNPITLTLAGTFGGFAARSLGAGFGTTRLVISAAAGLSEGAAVGTGDGT